MITKLTNEQLIETNNNEIRQKACGLTTIIRKLLTEEVVHNRKHHIKVNLPASIEDFSTGNGEGIWVIPTSPTDKAISDSSVKDTTFMVTVYNICIHYPFRIGTQILVRNTSKTTRPVLDKEWIDSVIKSVEGSTSIEDYLA